MYNAWSYGLNRSSFPKNNTSKNNKNNSKLLCVLTTRKLFSQSF
jgi:hypothetical protein